MTDLMLYKSIKCSSKLVAHGHHTRCPWHGAIGRQVFRAQRSRRNKCIEARATVVHERVACPEQPAVRPFQVLPLGISQAQPPLRHTEVKVHLSMRYTCTFGTQVAVIGSHQGWQTSAAVPMTWQSGDIWIALLTLPVGSDIEYKYIVIDESGSVIRWQEGSNLKLSLRNPGFTMHVSDSWAQDRRQVHEIGVPAAPEAVPAAAAAIAAQAVPAVPAEAAAAPVPAAAARVPAAAAAAAVPAEAAAQAAEAVPAPAAAAPPPRSSSSSPACPPAATDAEGAGRDHGSSNGRRSSSKLQNNIAAFSWPVVAKDTLEPPAPTAAAAAAAKPMDSPTPQQQQQQQQGPFKRSPATDPQHSQRSTPADTSISSERVQQKQHPLLQQLQQQQQQLAAPADLSVSVSELLPLLQHELSSALAALTSCAATQPDFSTTELISEGKAVLAVLHSQTAAAASSSSDGKSHVGDIDSLSAVSVSSSTDTAPGALDSSVTTRQSGANSNSRVTRGPSSSSSSSRVMRGRRSPGGSAGSSLALEDDIAAALLSDNCQEACICLVDAISMESESGKKESCGVVNDVLSDDTLQLQQQQQQQGVTVLAAAAGLQSNVNIGEHGHPVIAVQPVLVEAAATAKPAAAESIRAAAAAAVAPEEPVTAEQLAQTAQRSVAAAAVARPVDASTRAAAFAGVQRALDHSALLLDRLSDPSHPMLLAADRELAGATQQLGQLLPA